MPPRMLFVISAPRSGSTMLERMLEAHSQIKGGPEPHLLTPLAHLGVWDKVNKAPYDHILAAEAQKLFVSALPRKEQDYWEACRAYCDVLYGRFLGDCGKPVCMDKTPAYALVLPFIAKVFPDAKYVVLTRHPIATFASYANSFFDGDYELAQQHNQLLNRYVPAIASFLRQKEVSVFHVRYEDLVHDPAVWMQRIHEYIGVVHEPETIDYGLHEKGSREGLGDPTGVAQHTRPVTSSVAKWVEDLLVDPAKLELMRRIISQLDPGDLTLMGYPPDTIWRAFDERRGQPVQARRPKLDRYRLQRKLIIAGRSAARKSRLLAWGLSRIRLACDVLLREG